MGNETKDSNTILVPITVKGHHLYVNADSLSGPPAYGSSDGYQETPISARQISLDAALEAVAAFADEIIVRTSEVGSDSINVEFGFELALESGQLIAILGKVSSKSSIKIGLSWNRPRP